MRAIKLEPRNQDEVKREDKRRKQHSWNSWTHLKFVRSVMGTGTRRCDDEVDTTRVLASASANDEPMSEERGRDLGASGSS